VAEGTGLLNRHTGFTGIEGSNPFLSAGRLSFGRADGESSEQEQIDEEDP